MSDSLYPMLRLITLATFCLLFTSTTSAQCGKWIASPCAEYGQSSVVFIGRFLAGSKIVEKRAGQTKDFYYGHITFETFESFRGPLGKVVELESPYASDQTFQIGQLYLVYARENEPGKLIAGDRTKSMQTFAQMGLDKESIDLLKDFRIETDLQFLRSVRTSIRIHGMVQLNGLPLLSPTAKAKDWLTFTPVSDIRLKVTGQGQTFEVKTNSNGEYEIVGLPAGSYEVEIIPPLGFRIPNANWIATQQLNVLDGGCGVASFALEAFGKVYGRVLDSEGKPVPNLPVQAILSSWQKEEILVSKVDSPMYKREGLTNEDGYYEIAQLPSGNFLICVGLDATSQKRYLPTFYPGVTNKEQATIVTVSVDQHPSGIEIRIPSK